MARVRQNLPALVLLTLLTPAGAALLASSAAGVPAAGLIQQAPSTTATAAQAAPFLGDWTLSMTSQMGPMTFGLSVLTEGGKVAATIASDNQSKSNITDITAAGQNLVLKYTFQYSGTAVKNAVTLTPKGQELVVGMSLLDGQFEMSGTGTKGAPKLGPPQAPAQSGNRPSAQPQVAKVVDLMQMMAALPDTAPATPKQPRKVLILARAAGYVHSSIPLATRTIEALGQKTGAWTSVISYNAADITAANLQQYDAIFLASTTGTFLDDPADQAATTARRAALLDFVRSGKGIAGVHAATDAYHGAAPGAPPPAPGVKAPTDGGSPLWPEFDTLIGGYFKFHWFFPTQIVVKIDDPASPINAPFTSLNQQTGARIARPFAISDEVYTFNEQSFSRSRVHVLTSIDYAKMPAEVKAIEPEPQRTDHDYALSYIQKEGKGRVFVLVLGHDESIYKQTPILMHLLAGVQYAIGDLQADDSPSMPGK